MRTRLLSLLALVALIAGAIAGSAVADNSHFFADKPGAGPDGLGPYSEVKHIADEVVADLPCALTSRELAARVLSITWPEVAPGDDVSKTPHPMSLSRGDFDSDFSPSFSSDTRIFWHPGLGMWQYDDGGLRAHLASGGFRPYRSISKEIGKAHCASNGNPQDIYKPWHACDDGVCQDIFLQLMEGSNLDTIVAENDAVDYWGGIKPRKCSYKVQDPQGGSSSAWVGSCYYIDPDGFGNSVQADHFWQRPSLAGGTDANGKPVTPVAKPFYQFAAPSGDKLREVRVWLDVDTGAGQDIWAERPIPGNSRSTLRWHQGSTFCDKTEQRGHCS